MNKINSSIFAFSLTVSVGMLATSPAISAEPTPDGVTPANEMVCDDLKADGTTKGLYGLCVAYCEATDSPEDLTSPEKLAALPTKSKRILDNYNRKRGDADPQMPCATYHVESSCAAWTPEQLDSLGTNGYSNIYDDYEVYNVEENKRWMYDGEVDYDGIVFKEAKATVIDDDGVFSASFSEIIVTIGIYGPVFSQYDVNTVGDLSQAEYDACVEDIRSNVMP